MIILHCIIFKALWMMNIWICKIKFMKCWMGILKTLWMNVWFSGKEITNKVVINIYIYIIWKCIIKVKSILEYSFDIYFGIV